MPLTNIDQATVKGSYITFLFWKYSASGKTAIWKVVAENNDSLGHIEWMTRWRKYWFVPPHGDPNYFVGFEETCLREIAEFLEGLNKSHKEKLKAAKAVVEKIAS